MRCEPGHYLDITTYLKNWQTKTKVYLFLEIIPLPEIRIRKGTLFSFAIK